MLLRIASILFPIFVIVLIGYLYGRRHQPQIQTTNRLNMEVFLPALIFTALAGKTVDLAGHAPLALGAAAVVLGSGLLAWPIARTLGCAPKTLVPPVMFNNAGNMGLPLIVLTFGDQALGAAVILMLVETLLQFTVGTWMLAHRLSLAALFREPVVLAALGGFAFSLSGVSLWKPAMDAGNLLGEISIGLMIFSLGVRLATTKVDAWRIGVIGAIATPLTGMAIAWPAGALLGLNPAEQDILFLFGALPPAVVNFIFAERYEQEPDKVASIVMIGNASALLFISIALALRL